VSESLTLDELVGEILYMHTRFGEYGDPAEEVVGGDVSLDRIRFGGVGGPGRFYWTEFGHGFDATGLHR
jgi:hypothetical protein